MDSLWTEYAGQRYHVLGIEFSDPTLIFRTKRVIQCCIGLLAVLIIRTVLLLAIGEPTGSTLFSLLFNISIPAFGYLGARDGSSTLMCIFVALMVLNAANALAVIAMIIYASSLGIPQRGADGIFRPFTMTTSVWIQAVLISIWAIMALMGAYHANKLMNRLADEDITAGRRTGDAEVGLPSLDTKLDEIEPDSFGLPSALHERDVEDEFNSPTRRKRQTREMRQLSPQE